MMILLLGLLLRCASLTHAFVAAPPFSFPFRHAHNLNNHGMTSTRKRCSFQLFGIMEWRDLDFGLPGSSLPIGVQTGNRGPPKSLCLLPFPYQDVLLQGETKQLRLYEDRFIKLFRDVMDNHQGILGMALMAQSGVIQTVPLCEVEASNTMQGFGIFVTIRCVGRAQLLEISQQEPYLKGTCMEICDLFPPNLELPNIMAGNIENEMLFLSSMEHRLNQAPKKKMGDFDDNDMKRRIDIARLEDRFYGEKNDNAVDDNVEDDEDEDDDMDRLKRFRRAYDEALAADTQGYTVKGSLDDSLSPRELTATSWAAFCTELVPSDEATYRIQAMDMDHLFDRFKLAWNMLQEKKAKLRVKMQKAGILFRDRDLDRNDPSVSGDDGQ